VARRQQTRLATAVLVSLGGGAPAALAGIALIIPGAVGLGRSIQIAEVIASAPYPARLEGSLDPNLSRWIWLVKWFLAVPHYVVLFVMWVAFMIVTIAAGFVIPFTGRYPASLFSFTTGVLRWNWRVAVDANGVLANDEYSPYRTTISRSCDRACCATRLTGGSPWLAPPSSLRTRRGFAGRAAGEGVISHQPFVRRIDRVEPERASAERLARRAAVVVSACASSCSPVPTRRWRRWQ